MAVHSVNSLCKICSNNWLAGVVDMIGNEDKYICPLCKGRHYGEPESVSTGFKCARCNKISDKGSWKKIRLKPNEHIHGAIDACPACMTKLNEGKSAFIEIEDGSTGDDGRTGNIWFGIPPEEIKANMGDAKIIFIEKSVLEKFSDDK